MDGTVIWFAILGGFAGGIVMTMMTAMARKIGVTQMSIRVVEGALFTGDAAKARKIGLFTHVVVMSAVVIGGIYGLLFLLFDVAPSNAWWYGALFGVVHGLISGVVIGAAPKMHPRMGGAGVAPAMASGSNIHLSSPGPFAHNYGDKTPIMLIVGHVLYGSVLGLVVTLLAG
ncbi:hypothetical protein [Blastococcus capsensis]|uniref:hypothetical protein n=1 Tax=Blastococcus capsensis TaxID=1564163 RepID=UPI00254224AA|nr:hypothetical protein [Blastococcus capsensis]MDK3258724.1 hypothetical protein [Blastococcus capsensis]